MEYFHILFRREADFGLWRIAGESDFVKLMAIGRIGAYMKSRLSRINFIIAALLVGAVLGHFFMPTKPAEADIREVWMRREAYLGKNVRVSGTLKRFLRDEPKDHYAVESDDGFRIGVEAPGLETFKGQEVTAEGRSGRRDYNLFSVLVVIEIGPNQLVNLGSFPVPWSFARIVIGVVQDGRWRCECCGVID